MQTEPLILDAHLDLAMNAVEWNRDLTRPMAEIRAAEAHRTDKPDRGRGTVCLPEMRRGRVGLCVATLIARVEHNAWSPVAGWRSPAQAWAMTQGQRAWYRAMEEAGEMTAVTDRAGLEAHLALWSGPEPAAPRPIGYILSLEGADSIRSPGHLERAWADGLRVVGPAHYGPGVYANGTHATGGLGAGGRELLREMRRLGMILDLTHLCDEAFRDALDVFDGPVWASHQNCRALVPDGRQWSDGQIREACARGAVIGMAFDAWMMVPGWQRGVTTPESAGLHIDRIVEHVDHICQITGNARHVGLGSDLDGGFGTEQTPQGLDSIADLRRVLAALRVRGYRDEDIVAIAHGNFVRFLREAWR